MPKVYELLGYPANDHSPEVVASRKRAFCPFIGATCDGGGNRYMSGLQLADYPSLRRYFSELDATQVQSGICSIQLTEGASPWIICPRRMLYMGHHADPDILNGYTQQTLLEKCGFEKRTKIGVWAEAKIKYQDEDDETSDAAFDYTFDYVLMPINCVTKSQAMEDTGLDWVELKKTIEKAQLDVSSRNGVTYIHDFPVGNPAIVEVMTSSTSGGNKKKRSCIPQAFEDCVLGREHTAPGINYRQVWARMASQLIVKSQAAMAWNGKTIWVLQDLLSNYISTSTALNLYRFESMDTDEVNVLEFSYGDNYRNPPHGSTTELKNARLFSGPIKPSSQEDESSFQDIVLASVCPPRSVLVSALAKKKKSNILMYE